MNRYTKFCLTIIAASLFGIFINLEFNNSASAGSGYNWGQIMNAVEKNCEVIGDRLKCLPMTWSK